MLTLRGIIYSKYKSISDFARAIGWDIAKARRVINGRQKPTLNDVRGNNGGNRVRRRDIYKCFFSALCPQCGVMAVKK